MGRDSAVGIATRYGLDNKFKYFSVLKFTLVHGEGDVRFRSPCCGGQLKCDGTRAETGRVHLSRPLGGGSASVQSTAGSRCVRMSVSNAGYTVFRGSVKGTGYPLHSSVSPSLPLQYVTVCRHISTGLCSFSSTLPRTASPPPWYNWTCIPETPACAFTIVDQRSESVIFIFSSQWYHADSRTSVVGATLLTFWRRNYFFNFSTLCM